MSLPKWDGKSEPPRYHVWGHRLFGPPVSVAFAVWDAVWDAAREFGDTYRRSYRAMRSYHADRWKP